MKRTVVAQYVCNLQANVTARYFDGGFIELYGDERPEDPDLDFLPHAPIAVFKLNTPAFAEAQFGEIRLYPVAPAVVIAAGKITWARGLSATRKTLVDLGVGLHERTGNVVIKDKLEVRLGEEIVMLSYIHRIPTSTEGC